MLTFGSHSIAKIAVLDDEAGSRHSTAFVVDDLEATALQQEGPLDWSDVVDSLPQRADAAICDHRLARGYATFTGAALVAEWYMKGFPAILSTSWADAVIDELRPLRRRIPVIIKPEHIEPEAIKWGLRTCVNEFEGKFASERIAHRALVRIEDIEDDAGHRWCFLVIPAWQSREVVRLRFDYLPTSIQRVASPGEHLHAYVNLGAESQRDLYFEKWEER